MKHPKIKFQTICAEKVDRVDAGRKAKAYREAADVSPADLITELGWTSAKLLSNREAGLYKWTPARLAQYCRMVDLVVKKNKGVK